MPSILPALNEHVRRLARREVRTETRRTKKASAQHRRDIAALKRLIRDVATRLKVVEKRAAAGPALKLPAASADNLRFRADGLRSHRERLGLSAKDYGKLLGVSALTVYHWEAGKAKPRRRQLPAIAAARSLGKREALARLGGK
jgi:DNA-binding XRE family transcriptional regulator